jgi:hypothetical protein
MTNTRATATALGAETVRHRIEVEAVLAMRRQILSSPYGVPPMLRASSRLKWLLLLLKQDLSDSDLLLRYMRDTGDCPL